MKILAATIDGYRSLRDVEFGRISEQLSSRVLLFGDNAAGKSNVLRALNLVLVKGPRNARQRNITSVTVAEEYFPLYMGAGEAHAVTLDVWLSRSGVEAANALRAIVQRLTSDAFERDSLESVIQMLGSTEVVVHLACQLYCDDGSSGNLQVDYRKISIADKPILESGRFCAGVAEKDRATVGWDSEFLRVLTAGFLLIDCPRSIGLDEILIPLPDRATEREKTRWLLDLGPSLIANRFARAERIPSLIDRVARFCSAIKEKHGTPFVVEETREGQTYVRLMLRTHSNSYHLAQDRGTGFVQLLHVLFATYLSNASVVAVEELESNLSPMSQTWVWQELTYLLSQGNGPLRQLLVTSHSPAFLSGRESSVQLFFVEKSEDRTRLLTVSDDQPELAALLAHFRPLQHSIWRRLGSVDWQEAEVSCAVFVGVTRLLETPDQRSFADICTDENIEKGIRIVYATRLVPAVDDAKLVPALALDEWLGKPWNPKVLRVEWLQATPAGEELRVRVDGHTSSDSVDWLTVWTELPVKEASLVDKDARRYWDEKLEFLRAAQHSIRSHLSAAANS